MNHIVLKSALTAAVFGTGSASLAAPAVYPFEQPPRLAAPAPEGPAMVQGARPSTCNPNGSMTRNGRVVSVDLKLIRTRSTINNPDPTTGGPEDELELRSYGGCKTGPAIEVIPGDSVRINLDNRLSKADPSCNPNAPAGLGLAPGVGCFNTTNLHTHGLHVSPTGNSDNVLLDINPETLFPYEINIPDDHPSGTFWYHAHRHGSTAVGVTSGGSGALIIRGNRPYTPPTATNPHPIADIDTILHHPDGKPLAEQLFMLQQIAYACFQNDPANPRNDWQQIYTTKGPFTVNTSSTALPSFSPWTCPDPKPGKPVSRGAVENFALQLDSPSIWDTNGRFTSINGIVQPTLTIPAGELQRWRFVHAGIHDTINLQIVRAKPVKGKNLIGASALEGNRQKQKADVAAACVATAQSLVPQFEIATDGLTRTRMNTILTEAGGLALESNYLQPGYRSDIVAVFPEEGDYCLLDQAAPPSQQINPATGQGSGGQGPSAPQLLAYVKVRGGTAVTGDLEAYVEQQLYDANPQLPAPVRDGLKTGDLTPWSPYLPTVPNPGQQVAFFNIVGSAVTPPYFQINGTSYDPDVVNITRQVNTTDEWQLTAGGEPHIFHIHVNPFQIVDVLDPNGNSIFDANGKCKLSAFTDPNQLANQYCGMKGVFRDTVFVEQNFVVKMRTTYDRYIGEFVIHCHILDHEDGGMMLNIAIVPDLTAALRGGHGGHGGH